MEAQAHERLVGYPALMVTLLRRATVHAPGPLGRRDVVVAGGRILAIGSDFSPGGLPVTELDLAGKRLVPGLIDAHVHIGGGGGERGFASRVPALFLGELARAGITSVVGVLGTDGTTRTMRDLVARAYALREEGLSAWCWTGSYMVPPVTLTGSVRDDIVFVDPVIGVGELAISDHRSSQPTLDELLRVAADCHVAGLHTGKAGVLHLHLGDGERGLDLVRRALRDSELPARTFQPTHINRNKRVFAEAIALATERGLPVDVTTFEADEDAYSGVEGIARCLAAPGFPAHRLTASSDGAGCLPVYDREGRIVSMDVGAPSSLSAALAQLLARGLPIEQVLPVFTANVAAQLRLPGKGRIEVGADADLVVLDERHGIESVMARGRLLVREGVQAVHGTFERSRE
jgi:beta-aspartyl-dipeptidase (metallo-type)